MKLFLLFLFITFPIFAQVEYSQGVIPPGEYPGFYIDAANYKGETEGKTRVEVYFQIPYINLQFLKFQDKFQAKYSISLTIYDEDKNNIIVEKIWNDKIIANDFKETASDNNYKFGFKTFQLEPNNYILSCTLFDKDSEKDYKVEGKLEVRDFNKPLQFSDILFVASEIDSKIILNISNSISNSDSTLFFYYEIYSDKQQEVSVDYSITNENNNVILRSKYLLFVNAGVTQVKKKLNNSKITLGKHKISVAALGEKGETITGVSKPFISKIAGFPVSIINLDESIMQMAYIASGDEIDSILAANNADEKLIRFKAFWKKKDPSPSTEQNKVMREYFRRVAYANKNFKHYFDGWKTDMGMIYIMLGPPDNVDRHPFEYNSRPYEIWHYYNINRSFTFLDETGFGDYRLLDRNFGDWYRYRQ
ncbi:MAG: GWxTD domain-containing protein [Bacteroidetes bacterium]|nr:GWxTD domain-containing protein [Bacteroidota bacterium]MBU1117167.1 GWxTD domain-containing protein [Bacteroidota bacterium]MBU1798561.1 GWxTD domain-containing protein [Bacteroidota bacterium]